MSAKEQPDFEGITDPGMKRSLESLYHSIREKDAARKAKEAKPAAIQEAIHRGLALDCSGFDNPYGDGRAARHIVDILAKIDTPRSLTRKSFVDLPA